MGVRVGVAEAEPVKGRHRRARTVAVTGVVVLAAGAATAAALGFGGADPAPTAAGDLPPETATVTRETMQDTAEEAGDLGFGHPDTLPGWLPGVITRMPLAGQVVGRGQVVYRVGEQPVVLMTGPVAAYRDLATGSVGADVRELETNLHALGYNGFTVDDRYSATTAAAVRRWQADLGVPRTGRVELGRVLFAAGPIRVDAVATGVNQPTGGGQPVLTYTGTGHSVTVRLDVTEQRLARVGVPVTIRLPDGTTTPGRIERVATVVDQQSSGDGSAETKIEAIVSLRDPAAARGIEAAVVTVVFTAAERPDVLTVPVAALVALAEGGYGVEVVDGNTTRYIRVRTGLFAQGRVEVTGDGLAAGMTVGMPR
ncbi:peptidoglycan-binding protein [Hamadaea tsunoensis]|uniref:peptidoglycan-binding protein n=1 Tax=Hamadaea tsunoensis TaxID=53368 RepID=UPI001FE1527D|nr:peptidoglycan-binding protein [Hamadaea tsunoensis]